MVLGSMEVENILLMGLSFLQECALELAEGCCILKN